MTGRAVEAEARVGDRRPSLMQRLARDRAALFLVLAGWLLALEGIHAILSFLEDVMDRGASWPTWAYSSVAAGAFAAAALTLMARRWTYVAAVVLAIATAFAFPPTVGGYVVFTVVSVTLLALGYPAVTHIEAVEGASARVPWWIKLTAVQLVIAMVIIRIFIAFEFDLAWIRENAWAILSKGVPTTLFISATAIALAIVLALLGALGRLSRNPVAYGLAGFYTSFFRGTPLLVQLFLVYLGIAQLGQRMFGTALEPVGKALILPDIAAAIIAIGFNYGAYMTEIFRAGIQSVGHGQIEAADALGMTYSQRMRRVVLPQAVRVVIPPTGNEFIAMTKDSALASTISVVELFRRGELFGRADGRTFEAFLVVAAVYWVVTGILTFFQSRLERKMSRGYVRTTDARQLVGTKRVRFIPGRGGGPGGGGSGQVAIEVPEEDGA